MSYTSKSTYIIEAHFMLKGVGVPHDMSEKNHTLLRKLLCWEGALIFSPVHFLMHPGVGAFLFRGVDYFMIVGGLKTENMAQYFVVDGVKFLEHAICKYKRFSGIKEDRLDDLSINSEAPFTP